GTERFQRGIDAPVGVPCVQPLGDVECVHIGLGCAGAAFREGCGTVVDGPQCGVRVGEFEVDEITDGTAGGDGHFLFGDPDRPESAHRPGIRFEPAGENVEQGGLSASVLTDHSDTGAGGDGQVDALQDGPAATG